MRGAIVTFTDVYTRVLRDFPRLRTHGSASLAQFAALLDGEPCAGLGVHVEDYSRWFLLDDVIVRGLEYIHEYMTLPKCGETEAEFLSTFVNDLLIFGCLTISKSSNERPNTMHPGQYTFEKETNRMCIQVLSGEMMGSCLSELCFCLARRPIGVNLNGASLLSHIKTEDYTHAMPIAQRMLLVSLCNISLNLRVNILADPLFVRLRASPNLVIWLLACSGSDEQYFLNTCDTASSCISLIARHSTICSLLVFARTVLREIRAQSDSLSDSEPAFPSIWPYSVPSIRSFTNSSSNEAEQLFNQIESQAYELLHLDNQPPQKTAKLQPRFSHTLQPLTNKPDYTDELKLEKNLPIITFLQQYFSKLFKYTKLQNQFSKTLQTRTDKPSYTEEPPKNISISPEQYLSKIFQLTKEWNRAMQVLSSVFLPASPIVLTRKPFSERWHLSALVMWVLCSMTKYIPGQPASQARTRSAHEISQINPHLYHTFRTQVTHYEDDCIFHDFSYRVRTSNPKGQSKLVKFLWTKTIKRGGILFSSREYVKGVGWVGHLNVLFACVLPTNNHIPDGADVQDILTDVKKKLFLIADPEICNFKVLTFMQMFELLCNENYNFNLLDVGKSKS